MSYAYKPLHDELGHAFLNTVMFLDYDRKGFDHPLVPFQINCYGRKVISQYGGMVGLDEAPRRSSSIRPRRCPGAALISVPRARVLARSPWRVALIASSSWSHAFLTRKTYFLYPDIPSDRALYEALRTGDYATWRQTPLSAIEESGQQELLNWMCLAGAMAELGRNRPRQPGLRPTFSTRISALRLFSPSA